MVGPQFSSAIIDLLLTSLVNGKSSSMLFALRKVYLSMVRHSPYGIHAVRLNISRGASWISCSAEGGMESSQTFLLERPVFARSRLKKLGVHTFRHPGEIVEIETRHISKFEMGAMSIYHIIRYLTKIVSKHIIEHPSV